MEHNVINIADAIEHKIYELEDMRGKISKLVEDKAKAISQYDKAMAREIFLLRDKGTSVSIVDKMARGKCVSQRYDMELAEGLYKALISNMNCLQAELNGWQSINRHLSEK